MIDGIPNGSDRNFAMKPNRNFDRNSDQYHGIRQNSYRNSCRCALQNSYRCRSKSVKILNGICRNFIGLSRNSNIGLLIIGVNRYSDRISSEFVAFRFAGIPIAMPIDSDYRNSDKVWSWNSDWFRWNSDTFRLWFLQTPIIISKELKSESDIRADGLRLEFRPESRYSPIELWLCLIIIPTKSDWN